MLRTFVRAVEFRRERVSARSTPGGRAILLDIEGTTTPIAFVVDVLFPYARRHLRRHLERHATRPDYQLLFDRFRYDHASRQRAGDPVPMWVDRPATARLASVAAYAEWLIDRNSKSTALKDLQGKIWQEGYERGELAGEVLEDVPRAFERWRAAGVQIGIFSSGSVLAQQLLFRHSSAGDLGRFLRWHFDTTTGSKTDVDSYRRIGAATGIPTEDISFISDTTRELEAARRAGMDVRLAVRPGNVPQGEHDFVEIRSFDEL